MRIISTIILKQSEPDTKAIRYNEDDRDKGSVQIISANLDGY